MASTSKKKLCLNTVSVNLGCNSCKKPNLSNVFQPKRKPNNTTTIYHNHHHLYYSSSTSSKTTNTATTTPTTTSSSPVTDTPHHNYYDTTNRNNVHNKKKTMKNKNRNSRTTVQGLGRVGGESLAVEKDSDDPYLDFRHSMLQMILEKEIYSKDDLKELLNCFLQLNSPYHHGIIVRAFTEIWNGVYSVNSSSSSFNPTTSNLAYSCSPQQQQHHHYYEKLHYFYG